MSPQRGDAGEGAGREVTVPPSLSAVLGRVRCLLDLHTYIGYKVLEFTRDKALAGIIIREKAGVETLNLPAMGAFIAAGLEPNCPLAARQYLLNLRKTVCGYNLQ